MSEKKKGSPGTSNKVKSTRRKEKSKLHPRSKHKERYDFKKLIESSPDLAEFVKSNIHGDESIDFADPKAVRELNTALLKHFYGINFWDIPSDYLCPPIPGRADYIDHMADLLGSSNYGKIPEGDKILCLDIGVGASCIYPIIGSIEYGWSFIGSDTDSVAIESAKRIIKSNSIIKDKVIVRLQDNPQDFFYGIIPKDKIFDLSVCNPPFHASMAEAQSGTLRKLKNLSNKKVDEPILNFGGKSSELWCEGGEKRFVGKMIRQSKKFSSSCYWFTSLISKESNLKSVYEALNRAEAVEVKTIPMGTGNKSSRIVAWTFLSPEERKKWKESRWK